MPDALVHFAIHADDVSRAEDFYRRVFKWSFQRYGPPDFVQVKDENGGDLPVRGAIQSRKYNVLGSNVLGFECSVQVDDLDATAKAVENAGGKILMGRTAIPGVGWIIKFQDSEGNLVCAITYNATAR
jgi:predicted enzyme related to lactoylglutathione lyase